MPQRNVNINLKYRLVLGLLSFVFWDVGIDFWSVVPSAAFCNCVRVLRGLLAAAAPLFKFMSYVCLIVFTRVA